MVWPPSVARHPGDRGGPGRRGHAQEHQRRAFMFNTSRVFKERPRTAREADRWYVDKRTTAAPRSVRRRGSRGRSTRSEAAGARPTAGVFLDIAPGATPTTSASACLHVPPVQGAGRSRHHQGADGGRSHLPLRDGRGGGSTPTRRRPRCPDSRGREVAGACTQQRPGATPSATSWCSAGARSAPPRSTPRTWAAPQGGTRDRWSRSPGRCSSPSPGPAREPVHHPVRPAGDDAEPGRIIRVETELKRRSGSSRPEGARQAGARRGGRVVQPAGTPRSTWPRS